jgi:ribose transport system ATP-binding protein
MDCPTRGIDIGVKAAMYSMMYELKKKGKSIIMISEELLELIGMSDRMLIMKDGKIVTELQRDESITESLIIEHMI